MHTKIPRLTTLVALGLLAALLTPTAAADDDLIPDEQEAVVCGLPSAPSQVCYDRDGDGDAEDLDVNAFPMEAALGPACDAAGENAPQQVCVLRFLTLGQSLCLVRTMAPGGGAVLVCSGGSISVHCSGGVPAEAVVNVLSDADCDGHSNDTEAGQGCDPLDPASYPTGPGKCTSGSGGADPLAVVDCSESGDPQLAIGQLISDADCDGYSNDHELGEGCDPTDPGDNPGSPDGCTLLVLPDPGALPVPGAMPVDPGEPPIPAP